MGYEVRIVWPNQCVGADRLAASLRAAC